MRTFKHILQALVIGGITLVACTSGSNRTATGPEEGTIYKANYDSVRVNWTVNWAGADDVLEGTFENVAISAGNEGTPTSVLENAAMEIYVPLIESGDPKMNSRIVEYFFGSSPDDHFIGVQIASYEGTEATGKAQANVQIARNEFSMELDYFVNDDVVELQGVLDLSGKRMEDRFTKLEEVYGEGRSMAPTIGIYVIARLDKVGGASASGGQSIQ